MQIPIPIGDLVVALEAATNGSSKLTVHVATIGDDVPETILDDLEELLIKAIGSGSNNQIRCRRDGDDGQLVFTAHPYRPEDGRVISATQMLSNAKIGLMGLSRKLSRPFDAPSLEQAMDEALERLPAGRGKLSVTQFADALMSKLAVLEQMCERSGLVGLCRDLASEIFAEHLNTQEKIQSAAEAKLENLFPAAPEGNETEIQKRAAKINYCAGELAENAFRIMTHGVEAQRAV